MKGRGEILRPLKKLESTLLQVSFQNLDPLCFLEWARKQEPKPLTWLTKWWYLELTLSPSSQTKQQIHKASGSSENLHPPVFNAVSFFFWADPESTELWSLSFPHPKKPFLKSKLQSAGHLSEITTKLQRNNPTVNQKSERETSRKDYKGRKKQMAWRVDYNTSSLPRQRRNWYQMLLGALSLPCARPAEPWRGPMQHYLSIWDK